MTRYQYALEFGFNIGQAGPTRTGGMMWGMGWRKNEGSGWSQWEHYDPRTPIVNSSQVSLYLINIGSPVSDLDVSVEPDSEIRSVKAFDAFEEQTQSVPWPDPPMLITGCVDGKHYSSGLVLSDVPHIRLGDFTANCQEGLVDSRFLISLQVTIKRDGSLYKFSQDPELIVGGDSGCLPQPAPLPDNVT